MTTLIIVLIAIAGVIAFELWFARLVGKAISGQAAKEALKDVENANRPIEYDDLDRVRKQYRRD